MVLHLIRKTKQTDLGQENDKNRHTTGNRLGNTMLLAPRVTISILFIIQVYLTIHMRRFL